MNAAVESLFARSAGRPALDWQRIAYLTLVSRALDDVEEGELVPGREMFYQFSARGHDLAQVVLGSLLTHPKDGACGYYRSRPFMLSVGLDLEDALGASLMRDGSFSSGRDIGVVYNLPGDPGVTVLPMSGGVGAQFTPVVGWAQAIRYRLDVLSEPGYEGAIAVALGGEASTASNGFWAALNAASTQRLPVLFYIEDNGFGISVPSTLQTPGGDIAANLSGYSGLRVIAGNGSDPIDVESCLSRGVDHVRGGEGPALVRLRVPRLQGHSAQDTQAYKDEETLRDERARDPLPALKRLVTARGGDWLELEAHAQEAVRAALEQARLRPEPTADAVTRFVFSGAEPARQGGLRRAALTLPETASHPESDGPRINMLTAIRRTLDVELTRNERMVVFGEDVGPKGGVHAATMGLQDKHGPQRVFDTSLSEEAIIGRAVGMAVNGLLPVPEIQFRKYADPAEEQLNDCGTMRWRTANRFAAPMVVRIPGGHFKCGDPWHSQCNEVKWVHGIGWKVAMPSNAADAAGLLRTALRGDDPVIFFEHRAMLDAASARRPYPGDDYALPFGEAAHVRQGDAMTVVAWGAMVARCAQAIEASGVDAHLLDLRTLMPWDKTAILDSVRRTHRCLVVHEDNLTAGFGAEIAAAVSDEAFFDLDAPVRRLGMADVASPHHPVLLEAAIPNPESIAEALRELAAL